VLEALLPGQPPFTIWPWKPQVNLVLFVHRVRDIAPGLYLLVRNPMHLQLLRHALRPDFAWQPVAGGARPLEFYLLQEADLAEAAQIICCHQDIAGDGCFSLGMLAEFSDPLQNLGAWFYPRLFWECGLIGQMLYLEAEHAGVRGTGIGCFFDDAMHEFLGLKDRQFQCLYHFTVGGPVDDKRITTLPAYPNPRV